MPSKKMTNKEHSDRTKKELISKATRIFAKNGYHNTSLDQVLKGLNLTKGALYHHFEDKKDVFRHVFVQVFEEMLQFADPKSLSKGNAFDLLFEMFEGLVKFVNDRGYLRIIVVDAPSVFDPEEWFDLHEKYFISTAKECFDELAKQGLISRREVEHLAVIIVGATNESMRRYALLKKEKEMMAMIKTTRKILSAFLK